MVTDRICSVAILLPAALQRRLERWAGETPGTSWPSSGGHVTLLPRFRTLLPLKAVSDYIAAVCRKHEPFTLRLNVPLAVADRTRQDYFAVFLAAGEDAESGRAAATALRDDLAAALGQYREDLLPEVSERPYLPHITLALGLSEREASRIVRICMTAGLAAEFAVETVTLTARPAGGGEASTEQVAIALGERRNR